MSESFPEWAFPLLHNPEENDSEWGRSCHFCGSMHGDYDKPLEHYINCPWLVAAQRAAAPSSVTDGHTVYVPKPCPPCEICGWYYNSPEDWQGREDEMPPPCSQEIQDAHDTHLVAKHGITLEEYRAGPPGWNHPRGLYALFGGPEQAWHQLWGTYSLARLLPTITAPRGGITFPKPPDVSDEAIREPDA